MVLLLDFDQNSSDSSDDDPSGHHTLTRPVTPSVSLHATVQQEETPIPNGGGFAAALACYPYVAVLIVVDLAAHICQGRD